MTSNRKAVVGLVPGARPQSTALQALLALMSQETGR
jgi:hypothetical protein